jgi:PAS domain-containing protein
LRDALSSDEIMIASTSIDLWIAAIGVLGTLIINVGVILAAWLKLKSELATKTQEIKTHTDVTLTRLNGMLSYVIHSFDRPCWLKIASEEHGQTVFRMLEVNQAYCDTFGIARHDYIGKTDLEAGWDHETAAKFAEHDLMVWAGGEPMNFCEEIEGQARRFRKIRISTQEGKTKGVLGYALDCQHPEDCPVYAGGALPTDPLRGTSGSRKDLLDSRLVMIPHNLAELTHRCGGWRR